MPTIALIAHDGKKDDMIHFTSSQRALLSQFQLIATGTTGARVAQATGLAVERMLSGPYGGDAQIATRVAEGRVAVVIFLVDPLYAHPHEPDIQGLLRICNVYNIPLATNVASARLILQALAADLAATGETAEGAPAAGCASAFQG
ncbi:MAG: methylglyoxal synthase [Caldilinea sp. CFX5]|nr:methylglyoxal synthase [Caldilinea sp. CFX5]